MPWRVAADSPWPPWRLVAGWTAVAVAATLVCCAPFLTLDALDATPAWGDARLITWTLAWHARWPVTGVSPLNAPFFAPDAGALANSEPMIFLGLAAAPLTAAAGPVVAFNVLRLLLPVTNAVAMACLVWYYLRDGWAALVAGMALAFAYSQIATVSMGLVHLAALAGFALAPLCLDRWWRHGQTRHLAAATAIATAQALTSWYAAVIVVIVLLVQIGWLVATEPGGVRRIIRRGVALAIAAAVTGALLWPLARPFIGTTPPSVDELRAFSLQPSYYTRPPLDTWAAGLVTGRAATPADWDYRRSYFPGAAAALAAAVGTLAALTSADRRRVLWAVPLGMLGFALSLGPSGPATGWRPFDLLSAVPGVMSFRAPGRMAVLVAFAIAMLAGAAVAATPNRYRRRLAIPLLAAFVAEGLMVPRPLAALLPTPPIFRQLAAETPRAALVLPMLADTPAWPAEADYLMFARHAWTPLANGYGRRTPSIYLALLDAVTTQSATSLGGVLRFYGISHVVVLPHYHAERAAAFIAAADASPDFERVAESDGDVLYRVRPAHASTPRP